MKDKESIQEQKLITLVPIGLNQTEILEALKKDLSEIFRSKVRSVPSLEIPADSYNQQRNQYHATRFLAALRNSMKPEKQEKILGITSKDLYVEKLNFVFGQAEFPGNYGVISLARLDPSFYGLPEDRSLFLKRALKEAVHELGHTFGLKHCINFDCVMYFSNTLKDTDRKKTEFCPLCKAQL